MKSWICSTYLDHILHVVHPRRGNKNVAGPNDDPVLGEGEVTEPENFPSHFSEQLSWCVTIVSDVSYLVMAEIAVILARNNKCYHDQRAGPRPTMDGEKRMKNDWNPPSSSHSRLGYQEDSSQVRPPLSQAEPNSVHSSARSFFICHCFGNWCSDFWCIFTIQPDLPSQISIISNKVIVNNMSIFS